MLIDRAVISPETIVGAGVLLSHQAIEEYRDSVISPIAMCLAVDELGKVL